MTAASKEVSSIELFFNNFAMELFMLYQSRRKMKNEIIMVAKLLRVIQFSFICLVIFSLWTGCANDMNSKFSTPTNAFGQANRLCIVADQDLWEGKTGDSIRYYFAAAYPILPQPEPLFDLQHFTPEELEADPYRKELRAYLIVGTLDDKQSSTIASITKDLGPENLRKAKEQSDFNIKVGYDKWAQGQVLVYLFAQSQNALVTALQQNFTGISNKFNKSDEEQFEATIYFGGQNAAIKETIRKRYGMDIRIPSDYFIATENAKTTWLRKETQFLSSNILIHKTPYSSEAQLTKEGIKNLRDQLGKEYISTEIKDTYMQTNDVDLPMWTKAIDLNGAYAIESRGIWEIVNDFMGGPFISYLILNKEKNELIYIDCFVHAPAKKKRDFMMHLEYIISSAKFQ